MKKGTKVEPNLHQVGQLAMMGLIVTSGQYVELLTRDGLTVLPTSRWDLIWFSPNTTKNDCAQHLAMQGVTINKVGDAQQFAYTWLEAFQQNLNVMAS